MFPEFLLFTHFWQAKVFSIWSNLVFQFLMNPTKMSLLIFRSFIIAGTILWISPSQVRLIIDYIGVGENFWQGRRRQCLPKMALFLSIIFIVSLSKTIEIRFVLLLLLLRHKLSHSDQDQTRSGLDRIRHDQGFPNLLRKMASWGGIFRNKFGKSGQDQTRSGLHKFGGNT